MSVSVITSVYNCQDYVGEMLDSILDQTFQDWECIVVDDASTDHTWDVIKKYSDRRILAIHNEKNEGLTKNLNKCIARARGKYLVRIDGDDKACPFRFEKQIRFMEEHPQVVVSGSYMQNFGQRYDVAKLALENDRMRVNLLFNSVIYHPTFIVRKDILDKFHISYDENFQYAQDYNLLYQLMQHGEIQNIPEALTKRRVHGGQIGKVKYEQQRKCADDTRRLMLRLLDIELEEAEESCWFNWCVDNQYGNASSEREILCRIQEKILEKNRVRQLFDQSILEDTLQKRTFIETVNRKPDAEGERDKYLTLFLMMNQWVKVKQKGKNVTDYLHRKGYKRIAIYGVGYAGETLLSELENTDIEIAYLVDRNVKCLPFNLPIVMPGDVKEEVDVIIVTAVTFFDEIRKDLKRKIESPIVSLGDVLFDL